MPPNELPSAVFAPAQAFDYDRGACGPVRARAIPVETPIELAFGGAPFAVMMATPRDLEDFAVGFALTEGIVERVDEIRNVEVEAASEGLRLDIALSGERLSAHLARSRAMSGRTGCGLCGLEDLAHLPKPQRPVQAGAPIAPAAIRAALQGLERAQPLNAQTRAVHGAAWSDRSGAILLAREDVGRHNALDKLIGALALASIDPSSGFIVLTSRCSFEMVVKAAAFGASTLVSVSAPTSLALERARACGLTLIAIARADQATIFTIAADDASGGLAA
ncbi:MAG TPA: formate dehydrogenase accessory sulfurtransferase FdhD [Roseiarcus sp.]|nr:formate dehydrogenase accessory sulfurtransferase FdhD [Roseiarcus sp.]